MEKDTENQACPTLAGEVKQEVKAHLFHNVGFLRIDYFTLFWIFVAGCVFGLVVETVFHAIVYGGYEEPRRAGVGALLPHLRHGSRGAHGVAQPILPFAQPGHFPDSHGGGVGHRVCDQLGHGVFLGRGGVELRRHVRLHRRTHELRVRRHVGHAGAGVGAHRHPVPQARLLARRREAGARPRGDGPASACFWWWTYP